LSVAVITLTIFIFECTLVSQDGVTKRKQERKYGFFDGKLFSDFFQRNRKGGGGGKSQKQKADVCLCCDHIRRCSFEYTL
jgi:hypothetical protein